jgi:putative peptidoglycan lipid II flippase
MTDGMGHGPHLRLALSMHPLIATTRLMLVAYWLALATATHWPGLGIQQAGELGLDKLIHAAAFALLTALLYRARLLEDTFRNAVMAVLVVAAYACVDEATQPLFHRTFSTSDLLFNQLGVLLVAAGLLRSRGAMIFARLALIVLTPLALLILLLPDARFDLPRWIPGALGPGATTGEMFKLSCGHMLHVVGAMVLMWLLAAARPFGRERRWAAPLFAIVAVGLIVPIIAVTGDDGRRAFEWSDLIAHELGLWFAVLIGLTYGLALRSTGRHRLEPQVVATSSSDSAGFVRHSRTVGGLTLVSRFTGLVRDAVIAATFGMGPIASAFYLGFKVPNLFRRLFGEGALTAAFIPIYTDLLRKDTAAARRLASLCIALLAVVLGAITLVGEGLLAWAMVGGDWSGDTQLAFKLTMIMLPYMPLVCLTAMLGGMLQVHGRFGPPAAAPILLNVVMIAATAAVMGMTVEADAVTIVAMSVLVAGMLQLAWQLVALLRFESLTRQWRGAGPQVKRILTLMAPMVVGLAVFQINAFLDSFIAFTLAPKTGGPDMLTLFGWRLPHPVQPGAVVALEFAQRLYQFPLGVFGIAIATAIFPALSHAAAQRDDFRAILRNGLRLTVFIGLPASAGLILVRLPLTQVVFQRGAFEAGDSERVAWILVGYASAIWAYSMTHVLARAFYALKDARTPLVVSVAMVLLNLSLNLTLIWSMGAAGLAWSTALCAVCQTVILTVALGRYIDVPIDRHVLLGWLRTAILTAMMVAALIPLLGRFGPASQLLVMVVGGSLVFAAGAWLTRAPELGWLLRRR